jgi:hypothetical protein
MISEADPIVRRLQAGGLIWCLAVTGLALAIWPKRPEIAAGVVAGGALAGVSFLAIKSSIDAVLGLMPQPGGVAGVEGAGEALTPHDRRRVAAGALAKMTGRYALLAVLAYVMIARLRLHPIGLVAGASSLVVAATFEAARWLARPTPGSR